MFHTKYFLISAAILLWSSGSSVVYSQVQIPELNWTTSQPSDWVNVKTRVSPGAVGNGIADDAAAIQKALDSVGSNFNPSAGNKVCYLPPGTYRITRSLEIKTRAGGMVVGCGRNTKILWDGPNDGIMFKSNGATSMVYNGIVWDGNNKANVGFDHASIDGGVFECEIQHENEAFINFTYAGADGMAVGLRFYKGEASGGFATSETMVRNCLFDSCTIGSLVANPNYLNIQYEGCEFRNCSYGTYCYFSGQYFVRDCYFEKNKECDIYQGFSAIRCTSTGSKMFFQQNLQASAASQPWLQDCHVSNWTNTNGAVHISTPTTQSFDASPAEVFDCEFTNPPNTYPPIRIDEKGLQQVVRSNNTSTGTDSVFVVVGTTARSNTHFVTIPYVAGTNRCASKLASTQRFLKTTLPAPTIILDAKKNYNAKGDNNTNDGPALQNMLNAAAKVKGAIAYIPQGQYRISTPLTITGGNYTIMGGGQQTIIFWVGSTTSDTNNVIFNVQDPKHITIKNLSLNYFGGDLPTGNQVFKGTRIRQTSTGGPSYITYDNIFLHGYVPSKGLVLSELGAQDTVHIVRINGTCNLLTAINCSQATIFTNFLNGGFVVRGSKYPKTGFFGAQYMNTIDYGAYVYNNQNAVVGSYYTEQSDSIKAIAQGSSGDPTDGRVTIGWTKIETWGPHAFYLDNFAGNYAVVGGHYECNGNFYHQGTAPVTLTFLALQGSQSPTGQPRLNPVFGTGATPYFVACKANFDATPDTRNTTAAGPLAECAKILDDFRNLGEKDLWFNYGMKVNNDCTVPVVKPLAAVSPFTKQVTIHGRTIHLPDAQNYKVEMFDARGSLVNSISAQGPKNMVLPSVSKATGVYMIKVHGTGVNAFVTKMITM